jgi:RNA polymerase sigma-70 factor, ECF subfamily
MRGGLGFREGRRPMRMILDPDTAVAHRSRLYGLARTLCGSPHLAEDLTQEAYVRALSRPRRLRTDDHFPYLARTLRNVVHDHWRAEQRAKPVVGVGAARGGDPEVALLAGQVYEAVGALPRHLRDVVASVDVAGMTYAQTAERLRIPQGTVMSRLHRGRSRVANALGT